MFAYTGLSQEMVDKVRADHSIYMAADGRISVAGLNSSNMDHVANAFHLASKDGEI